MTRRKLDDRRARHDAAYQRAKRERYAGRAVYKLEELDAKFRLIKPGARVLDLGCWPGSWLQYCAARVGPGGRVVGIDLAAVELVLPPWVETHVGDLFKLRSGALVRRYGDFDVVLSDAAPHTSGERAADQHGSEELVTRALELARAVLRPGGHVCVKLFQGPRFAALLGRLRAEYAQARAFRPPSTRDRSIEQYLVGRGLKASARTPRAATTQPAPELDPTPPALDPRALR